MHDMTVTEELAYDLQREVTGEALEGCIARVRAVLVATANRLITTAERLGTEECEDRLDMDCVRVPDLANLVIESLMVDLPISVEHVVTSIDDKNALVDNEMVMDSVREQLLTILDQVKVC